MDLELDDDQRALRDEARRLLADACPPAVVRAAFEGRAGEVGETLWRRLVELDWPGVGLPVDHGGVGLGLVEVGILVEELGRVVAPSPFLATVTQFLPAIGEASSSLRLADVAAGRCTGSLALAEAGRWDLDMVASTARSTAGGWVLDGTKTHVLDGASADELAVVARSPGSTGADGLGLFLVPGTAVTTTSPDVIDPTLPVTSVVLAGAEVDAGRVLMQPGDPLAAGAIGRALEVATAALALSTVATCRAVFETTLQYVQDRHQFGRSIGSFQAVKHRMADDYLAVERASALAWFAVLTVAEDDPRRAVAVSMAKAAAGECQDRVVRDGLQFHGAMGFTWEHDLHFMLKRAAAGNLLLGGASSHRARLGELLGVAMAGAAA